MHLIEPKKKEILCEQKIGQLEKERERESKKKKETKRKISPHCCRFNLLTNKSVTWRRQSN